MSKTNLFAQLVRAFFYELLVEQLAGRPPGPVCR